jgi:hypothetical protein
MSFSSCRRHISLAVLLLGLSAAKGRAEEANPDLAPATEAFTGRVNRLLDVIREDLKGSTNNQVRSRLAGPAAFLIALHAMYGEGGGGRVTRATLYIHAMRLAEAFRRFGAIEAVEDRIAALVKRKPDLAAKMSLPGLKQALDCYSFPVVPIWFGAVKTGGLGIEEKLNALARKGKDLQPADLDDQLLDAAHHTAVIADFDIARVPRLPKHRELWEQIGQEMRTGSHELAAAVQARKPSAAAESLVKVQNSCKNCHLQFLVALPLDHALPTILDAKKPIWTRTEAVRSLNPPRRAALFRGDPEEKARLEKELASRQLAAIPLLVETLKERDREFREAVQQTLMEMRCPDRTALPALNEALADADAYPRFWFTFQLRDVKTAEQAVPLLCEALMHREVKIADTAMKLLRGEPAQAVARLQEVLGHADPACRAQAAELLARLAPAAQAAVPVLEKAQDDPSASVRLAAAQALRAIGTDRELPNLIHSLHSKDAIVRGQAAVALGKLGQPAVAGLIEVLQADQRDAQAAAALALGKIGPDARDALPALAKLRQGTDELLRFAAGQAVKKIEINTEKASKP